MISLWHKLGLRHSVILLHQDFHQKRPFSTGHEWCPWSQKYNSCHCLGLHCRKKLGSKSEKTGQLENVSELFELLRWSSCQWDIEWQHVPYQTSNFCLRVNSSAFFALGQCLWPLSGPCELFDALGMQYPGQTPAPGWNSFGPISPPRPTQPTAPAQHVLQQPKGHVLQNLAVYQKPQIILQPSAFR